MTCLFIFIFLKVSKSENHQSLFNLIRGRNQMHMMHFLGLKEQMILIHTNVDASSIINLTIQSK